MRKRGIKPPSVDCPCVSQTSECGFGDATTNHSLKALDSITTAHGINILASSRLTSSCLPHIYEQEHNLAVAYIADAMAVSIDVRGARRAAITRAPLLISCSLLHPYSWAAPWWIFIKCFKWSALDIWNSWMWDVKKDMVLNKKCLYLSAWLKIRGGKNSSSQKEPLSAAKQGQCSEEDKSWVRVKNELMVPFILRHGWPSLFFMYGIAGSGIHPSHPWAFFLKD